MFRALCDQRIAFEGMLLKPNMVLPGYESPKQVADEEIAGHDRAVLPARRARRRAGHRVPLRRPVRRGGHARLNAMNRIGPHPWELSFSYGRALQQAAACKAWKGDRRQPRRRPTRVLPPGEDEQRRPLGQVLARHGACRLMAETLEDAKKKLDDEYGQVRRKFDRIHTAFDRVVSAGPEDDVYDRLEGPREGRQGGARRRRRRVGRERTPARVQGVRGEAQWRCVLGG